MFHTFQPEGTYHGTINLGDTVAIGIQKKLAATETEKLFYKGNIRSHRQRMIMNIIFLHTFNLKRLTSIKVINFKIKIIDLGSIF